MLPFLTAFALLRRITLGRRRERGGVDNVRRSLLRANAAVPHHLWDTCQCRCLGAFRCDPVAHCRRRGRSGLRGVGAIVGSAVSGVSRCYDNVVPDAVAPCSIDDYANIVALVADPVSWVHLAESAHVSGDVLAALSRSDQDSVRHAVAANPRTPPDVLGELANDQSIDVLRAVVHNPATPEEAFFTLAGDANVDVRAAVARHTRCPRSVLNVLAADSAGRVRHAVLRNPIVAQLVGANHLRLAHPSLGF